MAESFYLRSTTNDERFQEYATRLYEFIGSIHTTGPQIIPLDEDARNLAEVKPAWIGYGFSRYNMDAISLATESGLSGKVTAYRGVSPISPKISWRVACLAVGESAIKSLDRTNFMSSSAIHSSASRSTSLANLAMDVMRLEHEREVVLLSLLPLEV